MTDKINAEHILTLTTNIVSAHVSNNSVTSDDLPVLIQQVYGTLTSVQDGHFIRSDKPTPRVPIKKSVTPDYIICLEDGKKLKMLRRHLKSVYNMSPDEYREKWGLPGDYPTVAPNYAKRRSALAKNIGLGTTGRRPKHENI